MTASTELSAFVHGLALDDVPPAARERTKLLILDTLGIALAGN
jgi:2-methylcitrate dehydratase PrpD